MSFKDKCSKPLRAMTVFETKTVDAEHGVYQVWITRQVSDRVGDVVVATGGHIADYEKNPVVQWAHRYDLPPIAKSLELRMTAGVGWLSTFQFPPRGDVKFADEIQSLWRGGFINAASIGFKILKADPIEGHEDDWWPPLMIHEWELLEFSLVPIPANQDALRRSLKYLQTSEQRRRQRRRVKERERSERIAPAEFVVPSDSELLLSLGDLSKQLNDLRGALRNG